MPSSESSMTMKVESPSETSLSTAENSNTRSPSQINLNFPYAAQPDIIRTNQKDVYYQRVLEEQVSNVFRLFFGTRRQHLYQKEVNLISDLLYFCLTTLPGTQTLGEEYCDIMQILESTKKVPPIKKRATLIMWHVIFPYLYVRGINRIRRNVRSVPRAVQNQPLYEYVRLRESVNNSITKIQSFLKNHIHALHLAIFYFYGAYYDLSKRATGIRYIFTKQLGPGEHRIGYEVLGFLLVIQILIQVYLYQKRSIEDSPVSNDKYGDNDERDDDENTDGENNSLSSLTSGLTLQEIEACKCRLCLSIRKNTTATPCGHLFCWACIVEWCRNRSECPLCRQHISISHLLPIYNYR